ncbi:putative site-specific integrase-resolvase [Croceifilum oryzae]|uniref:Site-specific integrase-resolvase n=1 Tax=Croceifilum oryzae TaxID=1553429 RepID=A0AAJ1TE68_9BACL|nr:IS607 family transposase [Croceifilum oryzae]MDQ0417198.1 putative site-specific integrase-resolvase [Croceifilum oryzae]
MMYSIGKFAKQIGVTQQTLRNWHKQGIFIPANVTESGYRYYSEIQLREYLGKQEQTHDKKTIGYCRVSSQKQKDDLDRQIENMQQYLIAQGKPFEIISDIGSGINYTKKGLQQIIHRITMGDVDKVVVLYKDRLLRFGFELVEYMASLYGCEIEIIDHTDNTEEQELVEDLVQIVTAFSCRLQGKRANRAKKLVKELTSRD